MCMHRHGLSQSKHLQGFLVAPPSRGSDSESSGDTAERSSLQTPQECLGGSGLVHLCVCVFSTCGASCRQDHGVIPSFVWSLGRAGSDDDVAVPGRCHPPSLPWGQDLGCPGRGAGLEEARAALPQAGAEPPSSSAEGYVTLL